MFNRHLLKVIFGFCGVILLGLISLVIMDHYKDGPSAPEPASFTYIGTEDISIGSVHTAKSTTANSGSGTTLLSYQDALARYIGRRIEIDDQCHAVPNTMTFKNNTEIMIDNSGSVPKTLKIGKTTAVKAQGFKIINLSSSKLPTKLIVDCNNIKGIANISLYK